MTLECETLAHGSAGMPAQIAAHFGFQFNPTGTPPKFYEEEISVWKCYESHIDLLRGALAYYRGTI
jgi:hypothetical protein